MAEQASLSYIADDASFEQMKQRGYLVRLPENRYVGINYRIINAKYVYCRPWVVSFLNDLGRAYFQEFWEALWVNSAVRPETYQRKLQGSNGNAASTSGRTRSSHPTGATIDISVLRASPKGQAWLRKQLTALELAGVIEATEETRLQKVFHVMVFPHYDGWRQHNTIEAEI